MLPIADKKLAKGRLADLARACEAARHPAIAAALAGGEGAALLAGIASGSAFLWELSLADPDRLERVLGQEPGAVLEQALATAAAACREADQAAVMWALRLLKQEAALLTGLADLSGRWRVDEVTHALTVVADAATGMALRHLLGEAGKTGRFLAQDPERSDESCGLTVLAMGKQGAFELNYSSDIDLIVLYDPETAPLREGEVPGAFFVRLTQGLLLLMSERTS